MNMSFAHKKWEAAVEERFPVPPHIMACASAIRYDLLHGTTWSLIPQGEITKFTIDHFSTYRADLEEDYSEGDIIEETYIGAVADALRQFIDNFPSEMWFDMDCEELFDREPEPYQDEEGEWVSPFDFSTVYNLNASNIVEALFGRLIAREFN